MMMEYYDQEEVYAFLVKARNMIQSMNSPLTGLLNVYGQRIVPY